MPSTITDRLNGLTTSVAVKAPCRVATTANITLSGEQTIDGVAVVAGDRVLVKNQTSGVNNGIYKVASGTWTRATDFDGSLDSVGGTQMSVTSGTVNAGSYWKVSGSSAAIVIGTDSITITEGGPSDAAAVSFLSDLTGAQAEALRTAARRWPVFPEMLAGGVAVTAAIIQATIDAVSTAGGGTVMLRRGQNYSITLGLILKEGVILDLNGGKLTLNLSGATDRGVQLRSYSGVEGNGGEIEVVSTGTPGTQGIYHSPVTIGAPYGEGGTVASPSADEGVTNWFVRNVKLHSNKLVSNVGAWAIAIYGGANNGVIENIEVPDHARMMGLTGFEWGYLGSLSSTATKEVMDANKTAFNAGTAYTTHPHNIIVRNCRLGAMTLPATGGVDIGSFGVRVSSGYNLLIENIRIKSTSYRGFVHTVGDLGFEFAPAAVKPFAAKNVVFRNCLVEDCTTGYLISTDSYADNVGTAAALGTPYVPLIDPLHETNVLFENMVGRSSSGATATYGARILQQRGGVLRDINLSLFNQGINIDEKIRRVTIERPNVSFCRQDGIYIHHGTTPPEDVLIVDPYCHDNGTDTGGYPDSSGLYIGTSKRVIVERGIFGKAGAVDPTQRIGIRVVTGAVGTEIYSPRIQSARVTDGIGIIVLASTGYNAFGLLQNPRYETAYVATLYGGLDCYPIERTNTGTGVVLTRYRMVSSVTPTALTLVVGDRIEYTNPVLGGPIGTACTTAGAVGSGAVLTPYGHSVIEGSATYDPASLADGAGATTTVTATGAALGDYAEASFSLDLQGITLTAWVSAANTVSVRFQNETGGVLDLASGTLRVRVRKA